ncbi:MAG TPA: hypothetical protein VNH17_20970 [Streptosporangiaceae bacterium]|nr:hypothetical protein [Streptosporangiaceae bacterium]
MYGKPRRRDVVQDRLDEVRGNGADDIVAHILDFLGDVVPVDVVGAQLAHCVALPLGSRASSRRGRPSPHQEWPRLIRRHRLTDKAALLTSGNQYGSLRKWIRPLHGFRSSPWLLLS